MEPPHVHAMWSGNKIKIWLPTAADRQKRINESYGMPNKLMHIYGFDKSSVARYRDADIRKILKIVDDNYFQLYEAYLNTRK